MKNIILFLTIFNTVQFLNAQCYSAGQRLPNTGFCIASSGYQELDNIVFQEINKLQAFFQVKIDFFYLIEDYTENAYYTSTCTYNCNGSIFLGVKMLYGQLQKKYGVEHVKAILAHEFGHCVQYLMGWQELGKRRELHSDFLSGYYTGRVYNYTGEIMNSLYEEFSSMGDPYYWDSEHHGTKDERKCAFLEGYYYAKENNTNVQLANNYGIQYIMANNPCAVRKYKAAVQQYQTEIQRRTLQLEKDIAENNVGSIKFKAKDDKKYKIVTINGFGQQVVYPLNQPYIGINQNGQRVNNPPISEVIIYPISANTQVPLSIYKSNWFFGDRLICQFSPKICRNSTVIISFDKTSSYTVENLCR